jgi:hypothetical protein
MCAAAGIRSFGTDTDPLAVKMTRVATFSYNPKALSNLIKDIDSDLARPGQYPTNVDACEETAAFKTYWFAERQRNDLERVASEIGGVENEADRAFLEIALSRIIITKFVGASLAWDVSHSRPHRKKDTNDFDVKSEFISSCYDLAALCGDVKQLADVTVEQADARTHTLPGLVELIMTSPPTLMPSTI